MSNMCLDVNDKGGDVVAGAIGHGSLAENGGGFVNVGLGGNNLCDIVIGEDVIHTIACDHEAKVVVGKGEFEDIWGFVDGVDVVVTNCAGCSD